MVEAQGAGAVFEVPLKEGDGFVEPARIPVDAGELIACAEGVWVVGTRETGEFLEVLLVQGDGFVEPARIPEGTGETVA